MSEVLYLYQTFTDCMSDKCTHFDVSTYKMILQDMVCSPINMFKTLNSYEINQTFTNCVLK